MTTLPRSNQSMRERAERARAFLAEHDYPLGVAMIDHSLGNAPGSAIVGVLDAYRNEDGGFGRKLEVDIGAPESNPFATRLAMQALLSVQDGAAQPLLPSLQQWLVEHQAPDGDWHLSTATRAGQLAPWFAGWEHPSLNPSCCLTGLASRLGIATPELLQRTATLFDERASLAEVENGSIYELLPYAEYLTAVKDVPHRDGYLDAFARRMATAADEICADASHFWDLVLALGDPMVERLPNDLLSTWAERLLDEQQPDGGWPTPYDPAWRPWLTATCVVTLASLSARTGT